MVSMTIMVTAQESVRMGIIGMTHDHVRQILRNFKRQSVEIVGFAEPDSALALGYLRQFNLSSQLWYKSMEDLVSATRPQAVCDFRSTIEHVKTLSYCAPLGIHVMVEKPLATTISDAEKMYKLAQKYKIHLLTNYETTWYAGLQHAFDMVKRDTVIGKLRKAAFRIGHRGPIEIGCTPSFLAWLTDPIKNGGGALVDFGCYGINITNRLMKNKLPKSVTATSITNKPEKYTKVEDEAMIILDYGGFQSIVQASWNLPFDVKDIEIYGESGYIFCDRSMQARVRSRNYRPMTEKSITVPSLDIEEIDPFTNFANIILKNKIDPTHLGEIENNLLVIKILKAAQKSAKEKKTIYLR
jgi:predicted dehydrogenase